ncbi:MAG: hypothetical protein IT342_07735 [Candidatus Melainabacteria bacterium]|nr:hypothetical protein [Candidatus Melainabacteria bacterium]
MTEFSGAMIIFILFIFAPLINIGILPVRYLIAHGVMTEIAHRMSVCEKRSAANQLLQTNTWWTNSLAACGVKVKNPKASLIIVDKDGGSKSSITINSALTADLLPNGSRGPFMYCVQLTADCDISPLFNAGAGLPGFTSPVSLHMSSQAQWENLGRDPETTFYYINE